MPNFMSERDMMLESGDYRQCEHCNAIYSVDDWHTCQEGIDAGRKADAAFEAAYTGKNVERTFMVTIRCMDTAMSFDDALSDLCMYIRNGSGSDPILNFSWTAQQTSGPKLS